MRIWKSSWARDLAVVALIVIFGFVSSFLLDGFEHVYAVSREYEIWELDEIIIGLGFLALSSTWFAWRRLQESRGDLRHRTELEDKIRRDHDKLSFMISASPGVLYTCEPDGDFSATYVSPRISAQTGYDADDFTNDPKFWADHIHPNDKENVFQELQKLSDTGHCVYEYRFRHADDSYRWMHDQSVMVRDPRGKPEQIVGFWLDITDRKEFEARLTVAVDKRTAELNRSNVWLNKEIEKRKRVETDLRESEQRLAGIVDNIPSVVCLKDLQGRFQLVNRRLEEWYGIAAGDALGKTSHDVFPAELADVCTSLDRKALETGQIQEIEGVVPFRDGSDHTVKMIKFPVFDGDGDAIGIGTINVDHTELRRAEEKVRHAQKMEAVGQFTGGVAHDFNNLMSVVMTETSVLEYEVGQHPSVQAITRAVNRGSDLTKKLLAFSRRQSLSPQAIKVDDLVSGLTDMLARMLGEKISFATNLGSKSWLAFADPIQLESVILNLAVNSRDAMPNGGELKIETRAVSITTPKTINGEELKAGDYICVSVSDTGEGMASTIAEHAFEPFFTTKEPGKGTGLGLSMVYGFMRQSGAIKRTHLTRG